MSVPLRRPSLFHDLAITLFIERWTAGRKLTQRMVLLPHQVSAERQCLANATLVQFALLYRVSGEIWIRQRSASDPDKANSAIGQIPRSRVDGILLQPAIPRPHHRQIGT